MSELDDRASQIRAEAEACGVKIHRPSAIVVIDDYLSAVADQIGTTGRYRIVRSLDVEDVLDIAGVAEGDPDYEALRDAVDDKGAIVFEAAADCEEDKIEMVLLMFADPPAIVAEVTFGDSPP